MVAADSMIGAERKQVKVTLEPPLRTISTRGKTGVVEQGPAP